MKRFLLVIAGVALLALPYVSINRALAQNNVPAFPAQGPLAANLYNTCSGTGTLSSGVLNQSKACIAFYPAGQCQVWSNGASAQTYAAIGIGCVATTTATATSAATATATTATYGGTTIATSTATSTATSVAIGGVALTASTLNASPVVVWEMIR